ncbi:MAG: acetate/propionate family kinase [Pseudomonadales bacterium]
MSQQNILVINAGSSSIKFALYAGRCQLDSKLCSGHVENIGAATKFCFALQNGKSGDESWFDASNHAAAFDALIGWLITQFDRNALAMVGHRIVHGGPRFYQPVTIDTEVMDYLKSVVPLAPLHQPHNITGVQSLQKHFPKVPQVACFDTGFHRTLSTMAEHYALPEEWYRRGIRRYGFHGLSYEFISEQLHIIAPELAQGKVIVAHLGNGASLCAMQNGKSVDTTMGFSALDGLPMGTRPGNLDAGVVLYLLGQYGMQFEELETLLYKQSGLLGLSGISNDVRTLLASDEPQARVAIDYFVYQVNRQIGALTAVLGGLDALVFTAGIGEHSSAIRRRICQSGSWLGVVLDNAANAIGKELISQRDSNPKVFVIPTNEELMIARHCAALV